jgi:P22_AR N-terminal domain
MSKTISIGLNFSGVVLPIVEGEDGFQRVPLKPICEVVGINWADQHKKMQVPYLVRRLGTCVGVIPYAGQVREMLLVRVDRVASFLSTINPDRVRAAGNADAADWLEAKHREWDDVLHSYEMAKGDLFRGNGASRPMRSTGRRWGQSFMAWLAISIFPIRLS